MKSQYVVNIALRRKDGKIENDTVYSDNLLTDEDVEKISKKFDCDVIVAHIGTLQYFEDKELKERSIIVYREKEEVENESRTEITSEVPVVASGS